MAAECYRGHRSAFLAGDTELARALATRLAADGWTVHHGELPPELDLAIWFADETGGVEAALREALLLAGRVQDRLRAAASVGRAAFLTVTRLDGQLGLAGTADIDRAVLGGLPGLVKTLALEAPEVFCRAVDLEPALDDARGAELLLAELSDVDGKHQQIGHRVDGTRCTIALRDTPDPALPGILGVPEPGPDDLLLVTGGARGITAACAVGLARRYRCGLVLLGRTQPADEPSWAEGVATEQLRAAAATWLRAKGEKPVPRQVAAMERELVGAREIRETLRAITEAGGRAEYVTVDITDPEATKVALRPYRDRVTGLVHGAGLLADGLITAKQAADVDRVLAVKIAGLRNVRTVVPAEQLRHVLLFSSVAGLFGNVGQSDYAMANEALNRVACSLRARRPATRITAVNWGAWAGGMVTPELARMFAERGVPLLEVPEGVRYFVEQFAAERGADTVCMVGPSTPLSGPPPAEMRLSTASLASDPVIAQHAIGGAPVLPLTAAIGLALSAVRGFTAGRVTDVAVRKGLVFDGSHPAELRIAVTPGETGQLVDIRDDRDRPRYTMTVAGPGDQPLPALAVPSGESTPAQCYQDGTLFHGPAFRGIREVHDDGARLLLGCRLPAGEFAGGACQVPGYDPVLADVLLQAVLVWARQQKQVAVLPVAVAEIDLRTPLPADEPFLVEVCGDDDASGRLVCTVTAYGPDGRALCRFRGVEAVAVPGLAEKFQATQPVPGGKNGDG
ncbi:SDR family NAD(P)-dependent oxidoreductase [Kutzneria sp. CA-103260]|uniref:SDR family NAD(P)-dependent oxidoreductase n=1 Tax=Kutzneria sp. CA-103260 TaxID=2802641 RepID=UPI001BA6C5A2|nr:SDR family NAD(P)-dependent oxidoreductase [Kutzneria sp. CA-103260]QUQ72490.1 beta keto-acyl synthase [Kutzneria sp. CA-103260]